MPTFLSSLTAAVALPLAVLACAEAPTRAKAPGQLELSVAQPVVSAARGEEGVFVVGVRGVPRGDEPAITVVGLPPETRLVIDPFVRTSDGVRTSLHVAVGDLAMPGQWPLSVRVTAGTAVAAEATIALGIPEPTFDLVVDEPWLHAGTLSATVHVLRRNGFRGTVALEAQAPLGDLSVTFEPSVLGPNDSVTVATITGFRLSGGLVSFVVVGSGSAPLRPTLRRTSTASKRLDDVFFIAVRSTTLSVRAGEAASGTVLIGRPSGYDDWEMPISFSGLPAGVTVVAPEGAEYLIEPSFRFQTSSDTPPGTYEVQLRVVEGTGLHIAIAPARFTLTVLPR